MPGSNIDALRQEVGSCLTSFLTGVEVDADGDFSFRNGSAKIAVMVGELEGVPRVSLVAVTNWSVPRTGALNKYVAEWAQTRAFCAMSVYHNNDGTDNVNLTWQLFGANLQAQTLKDVVSVFALQADGVDDEIQSLFGGSKFLG
jgi:hypothetical protein